MTEIAVPTRLMTEYARLFKSLKQPTKVSAVADKNAGLVKIDRKSVEWHRGLIAIPVLEVNSRGVDGLENR